MDRIDSLQFKISDLTGAGDMLLKREILVEGDAQIPFRSTEKGRDRLFWLCSEVMRISSVLSGFSWSLLWTKWTFVCRRSYPLQRCLLCVCKLSVKHRKMSTEMAEASSILFGRLVDIVVTLECSVLYLAPIKTMHSTWKCLYLFTWRTSDMLLYLNLFTLFAACHEKTCEMSCLHWLTPSFNVVWLLHAFKGSCAICLGLGDWQLGLFKGDD